MSSPLLAAKNYDLDTSLGRGSYGIVNKIITKVDDPLLDKKPSQEYALKQIDLKDLKGNEHKEALESAKKEYNLLKKDLKHVVRAFGSHHDPNTDLFIFSMELFPQNLKKLITDSLSKISFDEFLYLFHDILKGLHRLPSKKLYQNIYFPK